MTTTSYLLHLIEMPSKKTSKNSKKFVPGRETFWRLPEFTIERPMAAINEMLLRPLFNVSSLINFWKIFPSAAVERFFIFRHTSYWNFTDAILIMRRIFVNAKIQEPRDLKRNFEVLQRSASGKEAKKWYFKHFFVISVLHDKDYVEAVFKMMDELCDFFWQAFVFYTQSADQEWALRKLGVVVPRYSDIDRRRIQSIIGGYRSTNRADYLNRLFVKVGKEKFENLVFGKLKKCGTCGTTNREKFLCCCKLCVEDRNRPKQRYCDEKCQRVDWLEHRKMHPKLEKAREERAKAEARGKIGKRGKKKRKNKNKK